MRRAVPALLVVLLAAPGSAPDFTARVVGVSDGDTITVLRDGRTQVRIRLWGIDAPETGQDFGARAKQSASEVFGQAVTVQTRDVDRFRWHKRINRSERFINSF